MLLDKVDEQTHLANPQATLTLIDQLASELDDSGNLWLQAVNQVTNNEFAGQLEQSGRTALSVIMTQVDNHQVWENPDIAKVLFTIVLNQVEQIRTLLGERGLSMLFQTRDEIQAAFAEIGTGGIESKLRELGF